MEEKHHQEPKATKCDQEFGFGCLCVLCELGSIFSHIKIFDPRRKAIRHNFQS